MTSHETDHGSGHSGVRRAMPFVALALAVLLTPVVWAGEEDSSHHVMRRVAVAESAHAFAIGNVNMDIEGLDAIDIEDMDVGETRYHTTESGKDVAITREDWGYLLDVDGKEVKIQLDGHDDGVVQVLVHEEDEDGEGVKVVSMSQAGNIWVGDPGDEAHFGNICSLHGDVGGRHDSVFISGLGDLDEYQREEIIDALRAAGVEKEVHFAPSGGKHGFHFITAESGDSDTTVDVRVERIRHGDGPVIIIKESKEDKDD